MPRFPIASRDAVPPEQVDAFDAIVSARGGVVPEFGPIAVQLHVARFCGTTSGLGVQPCPTTWRNWP